MIPMPIWLLAIIVLAASLSSGVAGWKVEGWRSDAKIASMLEKAQTEKDKLQAKVDDASAKYEDARGKNEEAQHAQTTTIRTVYKTLPPVPVACIPPPDAVGVLRAAIAAANADTAREPRAGLQPAAISPRPASRP